jgi:hypothetical protein
MKIRRVTAELFHTERQTDMTKPIVTFRNSFKNARENDTGYAQSESSHTWSRQLKVFETPFHKPKRQTRAILTVSDVYFPGDSYCRFSRYGVTESGKIRKH